MVKSKFLRALIVAGNILMAIVIEPLLLVVLMFKVTYWKVTDAFDITYAEGFEWFKEGIRNATDRNKAFIRTGDLYYFSI